MNATQRSAELNPENVTVACYVRAPMLLEPIDSHVETLHTCESEDVIGELLLRSWPDEISLLTDSPDREVLERFETFEEWARRAGVTVQPPFEVRRHTSKVTGERHERLVTPIICLALYDDDGQLHGVYPHSAGEETYTVAEAIAKLRTGEVPMPLSTLAGRAVETDGCPECTSPLVDGQGLFGCRDCGWVGIATADGRYEPLDDVSKPPAKTSR